jgi:hypothetical protein
MQKTFTAEEIKDEILNNLNNKFDRSYTLQPFNNMALFLLKKQIIDTKIKTLCIDIKPLKLKTPN